MILFLTFSYSFRFILEYWPGFLSFLCIKKTDFFVIRMLHFCIFIPIFFLLISMLGDCFFISLFSILAQLYSILIHKFMKYLSLNLRSTIYALTAN